MGRERKITVIDAIAKDNNSPLRSRTVAVYARVSTLSGEQINSIEAQKDYYFKYIQNHRNWVFFKIYTDAGISGNTYKRRVGFNQMIQDALAKKFDLIITKSISRFARNTVDSIVHIRK